LNLGLTPPLMAAANIGAPLTERPSTREENR
jgi:hypothetical protein